jgi:heat shock protein HtpX
MAFVKRIFLFIVINFLVVVTISFILRILNIQPYLTTYGVDYFTLLIFCFIWGMLGAFISLLLSRKMAKWLMRVKVITPDTQVAEYKYLFETIRKLSSDAGLPSIPEIGIYDSKEVNAFATGPTKKRSLVAVSSGLLQRMDRSEIEAILAHELGHISNGDMVTMTLIQGVVNAFVMFLARVIAMAISGFGRDRNRNNSSYMGYAMLVFIFEIVFMILGSMVVSGFSRLREYRADAMGARLAGKDKMIQALESLKNVQQLKDPLSDKPAYNVLKISSPIKKGLISLFASHPPLEARISRLKQEY